MAGLVGANSFLDDFGEIDAGKRLYGGWERAGQTSHLRRRPIVPADDHNLMRLAQRRRHLRGNLKIVQLPWLRLPLNFLALSYYS